MFGGRLILGPTLSLPLRFQVCYFVVFPEKIPITFQPAFWWPERATKFRKSVNGGQPWLKP
jgi:hypothetical protein